jgi:Cu+-exporting ATPase
VLVLEASAEQYSAHPLAKAVVNAARQRGLKLRELSGFNSEPGAGVVAELDGWTVLVGSEELMHQHGLNGDQPAPAISTGPRGSIVYIARKDAGRVVRLGALTITDAIKPDSAKAIAQLHAAGLRTVLLTGDNQLTAEAIAREVGITDVRAQVKPDQKAQVIRELQGSGSAASNRKRTVVAMVGDGINDAPALATADLGIAIGGGSDIAKEAGDIILVSGSLLGVPAAIQLSRATMKKIRQNLFWAFIYNVIAIPLAAFGLLNPLVAAGAMALSDVTVIGNALLLRRTKID